MQFASETNAKQLWQAIYDTYAGPAEDRAIDAGEKLKNIKMMDSEAISDYISRARGLAVKCISAGLNISERQLVYNIVRGLYGKFKQTQEILKTQREKRLDEILEILREKERDLQKKNNGARDGQETAYTTKYDRKKAVKKKCFVCGKVGHVAKYCYHRKDKSEQEISGNIVKNKRDSVTLNKKANFVSEDKADFTTFHAFNTGTFLDLDQYEWVIDSGCTSHMTFSKKYLINYKPNKGKVYLAGVNNVLDSEGIGSLKVKMQNDNNKATYIVMHDVIYVPTLRSNLLSVTKLIERGLITNFTNCEVRICKNDNEIIAKGRRFGNHFAIRVIPIDECIKQEINSTCAVNENNMWRK